MSMHLRQNLASSCVARPHVWAGLHCSISTLTKQHDTYDCQQQSEPVLLPCQLQLQAEAFLLMLPRLLCVDNVKDRGSWSCLASLPRCRTCNWHSAAHA